MELHDLIVDYYVEQNREQELKWEQEHKGKEPTIYVSSLMDCPRRAVLSSHAHLYDHPKHRDITHPHDDWTLAKFQLGKEMEDKTWDALRYSLGDKVVREVPISNEQWSGRIDFLIAECAQFPEGLIIEHKATHAYAFSAKRMPYPHHVVQVLMYQKMLQDHANIRVPARLYYRNWTNWAEFTVSAFDSVFSGYDYEGHINGKETGGEYPVVLDVEIARIEAAFNQSTVPDKPYSKPDEHPYHCEYSGRPSCIFYGHCWGNDEAE